MKLSLKKKKSDGGEKKAKRKSKGGGNGMANAKAFFANHIEKVLLGAIALVSLMIVFSGFRKDRIQTSPDAVLSAVSNAERNIDSSSWATIAPQRMPEPDTFKQRATLESKTISADAYAVNMPFHPRLQEQSKKRSDPTLLAPIDIEVRAGYGGLAIKETNKRDLGEAFGSDTKVGRSINAESQKALGDVNMGGSYESRYFVSITGLVPYKKQFDLYLDALKSASSYEIERDVPHYLFAEVQRAEIQPDGSVGKWETLDSAKAVEEIDLLWSSKVEEVADPEYILKPLAMELPPIVRRDISKWAVHSKIPVYKRDGVRRERHTEVPQNENVSERARLLRGDFKKEHRGEETHSEYVEEAKPELSVEFAMLRYIDMTVEPGKAYKYRVQAVLEDPNNPVTEGRKRPPAESCETSVLVRLRQSDDPRLRTEWTQPSETIVVPQGSQVFAAVAEQPRTVTVGKQKIELPRRPGEEPSVRLLVLSWDAAETRDVPVEVVAKRGSVLNGSVDEVEAIDPSENKIMPIEDYRYATNAMVLDIRGGDPLGNDLSSPSAVLIWKDGKLQVQTEVGDQNSFELHSIKPDENLLEEQREQERQMRDAERRGGEEGNRRRGARGDRRGGPRGPRGQRGGGRTR